MADRKYILSLDGGGLRGIIPAIVLTKIEECTGRGIAESFDLLAGTSTGGIIALGLCVPGESGLPRYRAKDLLDLYVEHGHEIFDDEWWRLQGYLEPRYPSGPLEKILQEYFEDTMMTQALRDLVVTAYDMYGSEPFMFKRTYGLQVPEWDIEMWKAARSTSAAPTYFEPYAIPAMRPGETDHVLVDGGVFVNNPAICAYIEALKLWPDCEPVICSVGTGDRVARAHTQQEVAGWGKLEWAPHILDVVFDGVADVVDYQLKLLCRQLDGNGPDYYRFQAVIGPGGSARMDDASPAQVRALQALGEKLVEDERDTLAKLCAELKEPSAVGAAGE
jgi:patatin-like phospholipase/acyl hydrolase